MSEPQPDARKVAFRQGLIFGAVLIILNLLLLLSIRMIFLPGLLPTLARDRGAYILMFNLVNYGLSLLLYGAAFLLAGMLASRQTGQLTMGILTCLWANLWFLIGHLLLILLFNALPLFAAAQTSGQRALPLVASALAALFSGFLFFTLLSLVIGTGLGALGGLLGLQKARVGI
jgi:hypothetical protein